LAKLSSPYDWVSVAENKLSALLALIISIVAARLLVVPYEHLAVSIKRKPVDTFPNEYRLHR